MHTIQHSLEIAAPLHVLRAAVSTVEGFRAWFAEDTQVDGAGRYTFSFSPRVVTFTLDRIEEGGVAMTCVGEQDNPDWLGTRLTITLTPAAGGKTRVDLVHSGYPSKNECYERCIGAWEYFLASLALYATTGTGTPFAAKVAVHPAA